MYWKTHKWEVVDTFANSEGFEQMRSKQRWIALLVALVWALLLGAELYGYAGQVAADSAETTPTVVESEKTSQLSKASDTAETSPQFWFPSPDAELIPACAVSALLNASERSG